MCVIFRVTVCVSLAKNDAEVPAQPRAVLLMTSVYWSESRIAIATGPPTITLFGDNNGPIFGPIVKMFDTISSISAQSCCLICSLNFKNVKTVKILLKNIGPLPPQVVRT
jgi:hypothetical protein